MRAFFLVLSFLVFNGKLLAQHYEYHSESWIWTKFVNFSGGGGGGGVSATIQNNQLTVAFSAGFVNTALKTGPIVKITSSQPLPNTTIPLGTIAPNYVATVENGFITIESTVTPKVGVTGFTGTFTVDLALYPAPIPTLALSNYVKEYTAKDATTSSLKNESDNENIGITTNFYDGLGRKIQSSAWQVSPAGYDVVTPVTYDDLGRATKQFLPYVIQQTTGAYRPNAVSEQIGFYRTTHGGLDGGTAYERTVSENSPLQRTEMILSPGGDWAGSSRGNKFEYTTNVDGTAAGQEKIIRWEVHEDGTIARDGYYASFMLNVVVKTDENGSVVREYTDKFKRTILRKVAVVKYPGVENANHWATTYYVYDSFGNLAMVLPPEGVKKIESIP